MTQPSQSSVDWQELYKAARRQMEVVLASAESVVVDRKPNLVPQIDELAIVTAAMRRCFEVDDEKIEGSGGVR